MSNICFGRTIIKRKQFGLDFRRMRINHVS